MKRQVIKVLDRIPYIRGLKNQIKTNKSFNRFVPGHYHSPIPDEREIEQHYQRGELLKEIQGIDLKLNSQVNLLEKFLPFYDSMPWNFYDDEKNHGLRYKLEGSYYRYSDAIFLYFMLRYTKPVRLIEIGSGYSSALMLDTNDQFFKKNPIQFTFIEPNPEDRLNRLIGNTGSNNAVIHKIKVQHLDTDIYRKLEENDILFIDSSHISKTGSDLNFIIFEILPLLKKGVFIHFHDIFYPFEYPQDWLIQERLYWNECYFIRAFLMNNLDYEIVLFNSAIHEYAEEQLRNNFPETLIDCKHSGSLWLRKIA